MGRAEGIEIEEIVLHPFGGLARMRTQPQSPKAEFRIAIAGPAASFIFSLFGFAGAKLAALLHFNSVLIVFFFGAGELAAGGLQSVSRISARWRPSLARNSVAQDRQHRHSHQALRHLWNVGGCHFDYLRSVHGRSSEFPRLFMGGWSVLVGIFLFAATADHCAVQEDRKM